MKSPLYNKDIVSINDFSKIDILNILESAAKLKKEQEPNLLIGKILASCFFEPSTRTRLSFEAAMLKLGGSTLGFSSSEMTSTKKGETLWDTMKMVENYADVIVIRHPREGAARLAADSVNIPVINAGDGAHQHPSQTFLDLFTIQESQKNLEDLHIAMVGDLKYGRTVHSLALALIPFNCRLYFAAPEELEMPKTICKELREKGVKFSFHNNIEEIMPKLDILYMTRIQQERLNFEAPENKFVLTKKHLKNVKDNFKIMHPLPRNNEIPFDIDKTPYAEYFEQAENGLYTRQALLKLILEK